jgi:3-phosphoshikimate 1-carboxyvinyltransferase
MTDPSRSAADTLAIQPLTRPPQGTIRVPGSKSLTNRALILAALSDPSRGSELHGVLQSEDTEVMVEALRTLGFRVRVDWAKATIHVRRGDHASPIPAKEANLFVANSGTSMRFLTALVSLGHGHYRLDGVSRMRERPIEDLLTALRQLGVTACCEQQNGYPPVIIEANGLHGGTARIRGELSSQFLSGLLMAAPLARNEVRLEVEGPLVSEPYVAMTVAVMRQFGVDVATDFRRYFDVPVHPWYASRRFVIEPDASAASYFFAAAAITRGQITVAGLGPDSVQGDVGFARVLEEMGCSVGQSDAGITVLGGPLHGIDVDMNAMSDCVMTLAAVACFAQGPTTIRNVAHIRHKETDRLHALAVELDRVGIGVDEMADGLRIRPGSLRGAALETYNDHRMAMSMALLGLVVPGIVIRNPGCVAKTYPDFFKDLERLRSNAPI